MENVEHESQSDAIFPDEEASYSLFLRLPQADEAELLPLLSCVIGTLHVKYRELPGLAPLCNERGCERQMGGSGSITYVCPPWMLHRMASITFSPRLGFHMVLRAPRIVADDAPILRCAAIGDIRGIQKLITDGVASPGDVGASYGMTALHVSFVRKDIDLCRFLIQHHADPTYETTLRRSVIDVVRDEGINGKISDDLVVQFASVFDDMDDYESFQLSPLHKSIMGISPLDLEAQLSASTVYIDSPLGEAMRLQSRSSLSTAPLPMSVLQRNYRRFIELSRVGHMNVSISSHTAPMYITRIREAEAHSNMLVESRMRARLLNY